MEPIDVSIVVTAHAEGALLYRTIRCIRLGIEQASLAGITCEVILVLDNAAPSTREVASTFQSTARILETHFGDSGPARNAGIRQAKGRYIALTDGDDLLAPHWLTTAYQHAEATKTVTLWHPEFSLIFDQDLLLVHHISSNSAGFEADDLFDNCFWFSCPFGNREIFLQTPFQACERGSGFGAEDWHWYCEIVAQGIQVQTIPNTVFFVRRRAGSRSSEDIASSFLFRPTRLFTPTPDRRIESGSPLPSNRKGSLFKTLRRAQQLVERTVHRAANEHFSVSRSWLPQLATRMGRVGARLAGECKIPVQVQEEWDQLSSMEPRLEARQKAALRLGEKTNWPRSATAAAYRRITKDIGAHVSHLFFVPDARDLSSVNNAIIALQSAHSCIEGCPDVVIVTDASNPPDKDKLGGRFQLLSLRNYTAHLSRGQQRRLLARLCLQYAPSEIVNLDSSLGHELFTLHGKAIGSYSDLITSATAHNLPNIAPYFDRLKRTVCDSPSTKDTLITTLGMTPDSLCVMDRAC